MKFIYFDIFYMELWFDQFLALLDMDLDYDLQQPLNQYFEQNGFKS